MSALPSLLHDAAASVALSVVMPAYNEEARDGWEETFMQLQDRALQAEVREVERICLENPTDADLGRLLALKQQQEQLALERE